MINFLFTLFIALFLVLLIIWVIGACIFAVKFIKDEVKNDRPESE